MSGGNRENYLTGGIIWVVDKVNYIPEMCVVEFILSIKYVQSFVFFSFVVIDKMENECYNIKKGTYVI